MELRHLRYFVAVAEELHFGRAAKRLHIAQPPLSQQIRALEADVGVALFWRNQRGVSLTPAGRVFLQEAYKVLADAEQAIVKAQRASRGEIGVLRIGFVTSAAYGKLPEIIRAFRAHYPDVTLELQEQGTLAQLERLQGGAQDVGFLRLDESMATAQRAEGLHLEPVWHEPFVVALPERHRLAEQSAIALPELASEDFVFLPRARSPNIYDQVMTLCREAGFSPRIVQEASLTQTILALVAAGLGVTITPASSQSQPPPGLLFRPIAGATCETQMLAVWRAQDPSPTLGAFVEAVRGALAEP